MFSKQMLTASRSVVLPGSFAWFEAGIAYEVVEHIVLGHKKRGQSPGPHSLFGLLVLPECNQAMLMVAAHSARSWPMPIA